MKICSKCKKIKQFSDFYKETKKKDGHTSYCKSCSNERSEYMRIYRKSESQKIYYREYSKNKLQTDSTYNLQMRLRKRIWNALKGSVKSRKTMDILGCSIDQLKQYLESLFQPGMTWDNKNFWHIDHIIPLSSAKTEEELYKLCHFSNLQPLWAKDNLKKSNKIG